MLRKTTAPLVAPLYYSCYNKVIGHVREKNIIFCSVNTTNGTYSWSSVTEPVSRQKLLVY